ncbi:MAG: TetR/AcrR family transcriptional regulator [Clostridia bacterium]|nr:TetR/AcrR family transcriptional regulator [Clostridia bacterium]
MDKTILHRKESIIFTTIDVINEFGVQGTSTREIAKRQGISEATIFKHFKTKNELLSAVLDCYSQYDPDIITTTRIKLNNPKEAINFFVNSYSEYYENYPAITAITQSYDILACDPELGEKIRGIFLRRIDFIMEVIEEAQKVGQISNSTDAEKLAYTIYGTCKTICLKWRFSQYNFPLKEYTLSTLQMILEAFGTK